jgi:hypothetical protein
MDGKRFAEATALRDAGKLVEALEEFEALADLAASERERSDLLGNQANCLWRLGQEFKSLRTDQSFPTHLAAKQNRSHHY